jgi:glycosyltransferase involved in cell wall biosynthesis
MRVLFIVPYPKDCAPSQRLKFEQYYSVFNENGISVTHRSFFSQSMWRIIYKRGYFLAKLFYTLSGYFTRLIDLFNLDKYDVIYVHLWVTPLGMPLFEWLYRKKSKALVYDIDDLIYLSTPRDGANSIFKYLKGRNKPIYLMKVSDHVITCTPYLDKFVKQYNTNTTDISSTIDTELYHPKEDYSVKNGRPFILGWSGSHSTSKYLYLLTPLFIKLKNSGIDFKLVVMGDCEFNIGEISVEGLPWIEAYETDVIRNFDIGLYPLPDENWVYGKSGLKALQYMGLGVPTIATAIATNFRIIDNGNDGYLANSVDEWYDIIIELINSEGLRESIGKNGRKRVVDEFSILANADRYVKILKQDFSGHSLGN